MNRSGRRLVLLCLVGFVIVGVAIGGYFALRRTVIADIREATMRIDTSDQIAYGAALFQTRVCTSCHTLTSAGSIGDEGPNLDGIGGRESIEYLRQSIAQPNAVIADDCPEGACQPNVMPNFGDILTDEQIDALAAYLAAQQ
jgi:mono/diheme cytochrome c family protein